MVKKIFKVILIMILIIAAYIGLNAASIYFYSYRDETRNADVAIVLGASVKYKTVSNVYRERINHAISLYEKGYVSKIILTGGKVDGQTFSDSSVAKKYAISQGIKASDILIEEKSHSTYQNLYYANELMEAHNYKTALIISDALHMRRAMTMAEDVGIEAYTSPTTTSMYKTTAKRVRFLETETVDYIGYKIYHLLNRITNYNLLLSTDKEIRVSLERYSYYFAR